MSKERGNLTKKEQRTREGNARGGSAGLKDDSAARSARASKAGKACLAAYGREFYVELARRRHDKKRSTTSD